MLEAPAITGSNVCLQLLKSIETERKYSESRGSFTNATHKDFETVGSATVTSTGASWHKPGVTYIMHLSMKLGIDLDISQTVIGSR
jgi:hypothetical protein